MTAVGDFLRGALARPNPRRAPWRVLAWRRKPGLAGGWRLVQGADSREDARAELLAPAAAGGLADGDLVRVAGPTDEAPEHWFVAPGGRALRLPSVSATVARGATDDPGDFFRRWAIALGDDWTEAWRFCPRGDWFLHMADRLGVEHRARLRLAAWAVGHAGRRVGGEPGAVAARVARSATAVADGKAPSREYRGVWDAGRFLGIWAAGRFAEVSAAQLALDAVPRRAGAGLAAFANQSAVLEAAAYLVRATDAPSAGDDLGEAVRFAAQAEEDAGAAVDARRGASRPSGSAMRAQAVAFAAKLPLRAALDAHAGGRP